MDICGILPFSFQCLRLTRAWRREIEKRRVQDFLMRARLENAEQEGAMVSV